MLDIDRLDQEKESEQLQLPYLCQFCLQYQLFRVQKLSSPMIFSSKATSSGPWFTMFTKEMESRGYKLFKNHYIAHEYLHTPKKKKKFPFPYKGKMVTMLVCGKDKISLCMTTSNPENISEQSLQGNSISIISTFNAIITPLVKCKYLLRPHIHKRLHFG